MNFSNCSIANVVLGFADGDQTQLIVRKRPIWIDLDRFLEGGGSSIRISRVLGIDGVVEHRDGIDLLL